MNDMLCHPLDSSPAKSSHPRRPTFNGHANATGDAWQKSQSHFKDADSARLARVQYYGELLHMALGRQRGVVQPRAQADSWARKSRAISTVDLMNDVVEAWMEK